MQSDEYTVRTMRPGEVDIAVEWAAAEGWNPGRHDAACYYTADPDGFLIGLHGGEPVATISVVKYGKSFGFLGFYIVKPEYRGQGYGLRIWREGLRRLEGRNVGLDGVVAQQENYKKSGFQLAYRNIRYEGKGGVGPSDSAEIVPLSQLPLTVVDAYDRPFFPDDRARFIRAWINQPECHAMGVLHNGELSGYGVIRPCRRGWKIGPLFANDADLAESLFLALKSKTRPADPVYLDVPEVNPAAVELARRHEMEIVFETARMYTREFPALPLDRLFGVTSFEVG